MDKLIHADSNLDEIGVINAYTQFDAQLHDNGEMADNTFQLTMPVGAWQLDKIQRGDYVYINGTEYGGLVSSVNKNTNDGTVTVKGVLWRGLLAMRIISPPSGSAYQVYTNTELNALIADVIGNDYGGLFSCVTISTGVTTSCQFRYTQKLKGLTKALAQEGFTLSCVYWASIKAVLTEARACTDYSSYADISSDLGIGLSITAGRVDDYNHCIALGTGELTERMVREIWMLDGTVYTARPAALTEEKLRSMVFDYPNAESADELLQSASSALLQYAAMTSAEIDLQKAQEQLNINLKLGDVIQTIDRDLNISAAKKVSQRILTMTASGTTIRTEVD